MMLGLCQTDKHGAEHGEYIGLDEGNQKLKRIHEYHHDKADDGDRGAHGYANLAGNEDDAGDGQDDGVSGHDVGKETDHQGEGLGEDAEKLDDGHDGNRCLEPRGDLGPEDFLPVLLVAEEVDGKHGEHGQEEGNGDIACHIGTTGDDTSAPHR